MDKPKFDFRKLQEADVPKHYIRSAEEKEQAKYGKLVFAFPQERNEIVAEGDPEDYVVKYDAQKKCDSCGRCLQETWEKA